MNSLLELNIFDESIIPYPLFDDFEEFCKDIEDLDKFINSINYLSEDVSNNNMNVRKQVANVAKRTKDTTGDVLKVYGNAIDAGGNIIHSIWKVLIASIRIIVKITSFIINKIAIIPKIIAKVLNSIEQLPGNIISKIKGNINIYITPDAIKLYYEKILPDINNFLNVGKKVTETEYWATMFDALSSAKHLKDFVVLQSDMKSLKIMNGISKRLTGFNITPTNIEIMANDNAKIYFSAEKTLHFKDYKGVDYHVSYFEALRELIEDLETRKELLIELNKAFSIKIDATEKNNEFLKLNKNQQNLVFETVKSISTVVNVIGKFVSAIINDMNTIKTNYDKILKKKSIVNDKIENEKNIKNKKK